MHEQYKEHDQIPLMTRAISVQLKPFEFMLIFFNNIDLHRAIRESVRSNRPHGEHMVALIPSLIHQHLQLVFHR